MANRQNLDCTDALKQELLGKFEESLSYIESMLTGLAKLEIFKAENEITKTSLEVSRKILQMQAEGYQGESTCNSFLTAFPITAYAC